MQNAERRMKNQEERISFFLLNSAFCILHSEFDSPGRERSR